MTLESCTEVVSFLSCLIWGWLVCELVSIEGVLCLSAVLKPEETCKRNFILCLLQLGWHDMLTHHDTCLQASSNDASTGKLEMHCKPFEQLV